MIKIFVFLYCLATLCLIDTARILAVFPTPSISHQVVFRPLTQQLVKSGHEVVVITTDPVFPTGQAPKNLTEIDVHDISYNFLINLVGQVIATDMQYGMKSPWILLEKEMQKLFAVLELQVKSERVQQLIQEKRDFDLILIEAYVRPAIGFSHVFKAPVILVSSFGASIENLEVFGASTHPILYPTPFRQRLYNLTLWDKLQEYYYYLKYRTMQKDNARFDNELSQRTFGSNVPSVDELNENIEMLFLNVHPIWMDNQPVPPGIIYMGGLHQKPVKELPQDLKLYLDSSKNGVVYVSFGTNVLPNFFPAERLKIITEALSELPYDILFKWSDVDLPGKPENIKVSKWLPQSDLLKHPNIKAFLMQGGLQSTDEAITAGVPLVCIPMVGDQWYNAEKYDHLKIGVTHDLYTLTKSELKKSIETVIADKSYRKNIVKLRERMQDQPQSPLERAVWWTEYVLRHGGARHLRAPAANMSWAEYYELELVSIVLSGLSISIILSLLIVIWLWQYVTQLLSYSVKIKKS